MRSPRLAKALPLRQQAGVIPVCRRQGGFTLLEVLIAVTITAVIGIGVWQLLAGVINAKDGIDRVSGEFSRMQQAVVILERDLAQVLFRPVRDAYGEPLPAVTTRSDHWAIEFTRAGWRNPLQSARSDLQRVSYEVVDETLRRHYWQVLDRAQDTESRQQELLPGITGLSWRFLDQNRDWQPDWPSDSQLQALPINGGAQVPLPLAIEVVLEHRRFGQIRRLVDLGNFDPGRLDPIVPGTDPDAVEDAEPAADDDLDNDDGLDSSPAGPVVPGGLGGLPQ